jgi:hypothetical protein
MPTTTIGVATYSKTEYPELLALSEDRDLMDATWEEWTKSKNKAVKNLQKMGLQVMEVQVRLAELALYCREQDLKINGDSRAMFAQKLVMERTPLAKKSQSGKK